MAYLIGADEAGYGPNLGPLVIGATLWRTSRHEELYKALADVVADGIADKTRLAIADSKVVYRPKGGWAGLERGVFSFLHAIGKTPCDWETLWTCLAPQSKPARDALPWHRDFHMPLPKDALCDEIPALGKRLDGAFTLSGVRLVAMRCVAVFPEEFNSLVAQYGSKGEALSRLTLTLVAEMASLTNDGDVSIVCDKHGGRNRYVPVLQPIFPEYLIEVRKESRDESLYAWGARERRFEARFVARGERHLPTALASMAAKYLRELSMAALNAYWAAATPWLRPTAGYPQDARRFMQDIAHARRKLNIDDGILWRNR